MTARIDAHQHYWQLGRSDYAWMQPHHAAISRDFLPKDMAPLCATAGVTGTVLVQADATVRETDFMLEIAATTPSVLGVVGWIDFTAPDAVAQVERRAAQAPIRGLRPMLEFIPDPDWILQPAFARVFRAMIATGLTFDALVHPHHLAALDRLVRRHPDLSVVIDHGAKPRIATWNTDTDAMQAWRKAMQRVAENPQVSCKLSGLLTEAGENARAGILTAIEVLLEVFGPSRLIWGSDWPVMTLAGDYQEWVNLCDLALAGLTVEESDAVYRGNACRFYRISM
jgi:L-fuconolactonase